VTVVDSPGAVVGLEDELRAHPESAVWARVRHDFHLRQPALLLAHAHVRALLLPDNTPINIHHTNLTHFTTNLLTATSRINDKRCYALSFMTIS
jgi:hypothetical protein